MNRYEDGVGNEACLRQKGTAAGLEVIFENTVGTLDCPLLLSREANHPKSK